MKLDVALKEWSIVCDLLLEGRLTLLLRKGGIHESGGPGVFELEHSRFALFPSWAHQKPDSIIAEYRDRVELIDEPDEITIRGFAQVELIKALKHRDQINALSDLHCWTDSHIDMRFNYKPDRPLFLIVLRAYRLAEPKTIPNRPGYAGCRSWVPFETDDVIDVSDARVVLDETQMTKILERVEDAVQDRM